MRLVGTIAPLPLNDRIVAPTRLTDPSGHNPFSNFFDGITGLACALGGPALGNGVRTLQMGGSLLAPFIPGVGEAYLLGSAVLGQDLFSGRQLSTADRLTYAGFALAGLATAGMFAGLAGLEREAATLSAAELRDAGALAGAAACGSQDLEGAAREVGSLGGDLGGGASRTAESGGDVGGRAAGCGGGLSFSAQTPVETPAGERPISSLKVGDTVEAYNPATGKAEAEPIQRVWRNHDAGLVDVHLTTNTAVLTTAIDATSAVPAATGQPANADAAGGETIHTTANHPWLTADRGWVQAGELKPGESVVTLDGVT